MSTISSIGSHFNILPNDIKRYIFDKLDLNTLKKIQEVCSDWHIIIDEGKFTKPQISKFYKDKTQKIAVKFLNLWDLKRKEAEGGLKIHFDFLKKCSVENQVSITSDFIEIWSVKIAESNPVDSSVLSPEAPLKLKKMICYIDKHCSNASRLRFLRATARNGRLYGLYKNLSQGSPINVGLLLQSSSRFPSTELPKQLLDKISISDKNKFQAGELVSTISEDAVSVRFGLVQDTVEDEHGLWYRITIHYDQEKQKWTQEVYRNAGMLGKIPANPHVFELLQDNIKKLVSRIN